MCKIFTEVCGKCLTTTCKFNLIELCENYQVETSQTTKWISGDPLKARTDCQNKYYIQMSRVVELECIFCQEQSAKGGFLLDYGLPKVAEIAQEIKDHGELLQLVVNLVHLHHKTLLGEKVDEAMDEFGSHRFLAGEDGDRDKIYRRVLELSPPPTAGVNVHMPPTDNGETNIPTTNDGDVEMPLTENGEAPRATPDFQPIMHFLSHGGLDFENYG